MTTPGWAAGSQTRCHLSPCSGLKAVTQAGAGESQCPISFQSPSFLPYFFCPRLYLSPVQPPSPWLSLVPIPVLPTTISSLLNFHLSLPLPVQSCHTSRSYISQPVNLLSSSNIQGQGSPREAPGCLSAYPHLKASRSKLPPLQPQAKTIASSCTASPLCRTECREKPGYLQSGRESSTKPLTVLHQELLGHTPSEAPPMARPHW